MTKIIYLKKLSKNLINKNQSKMGSRPTLAQLEIFVQFLEENPGIAKGMLRSDIGRMETKKKWAKLAFQLNSLGGALKTGQGWAKYWAEKKCSLKKIWAQQYEYMIRTGGELNGILRRFSKLDKRLAAVIDLEELASIPQKDIEVEVPPSPTVFCAVEKIKKEPEEEPSIITEDTVNPVSPPPTRPQPRPRVSRSPRRRSLPKRNLNSNIQLLAQIERRRVNAEEVTGQALSEMAQTFDGYTSAVEKMAEAVTQMAKSLDEGLKSIANAILENKRSPEQ